MHVNIHVHSVHVLPYVGDVLHVHGEQMNVAHNYITMCEQCSVGISLEWIMMGRGVSIQKTSAMYYRNNSSNVFSPPDAGSNHKSHIQMYMYVAIIMRVRASAHYSTSTCIATRDTESAGSMYMYM